MMSGVRASSMRMNRLQSTMANLCFRSRSPSSETSCCRGGTRSRPRVGSVCDVGVVSVVACLASQGHDDDADGEAENLEAAHPFARVGES